MSKIQRNLKSSICENGHLESSILEYKEVCKLPHCRECGKLLIDSCPKCNSKIIGGYVWSRTDYDHVGDPIYKEFKEKNNYIPKYCYQCGSPYPWTEKKLNDFKEILELQNEEITLDLQSKIFETVKELVSEKDPETSLGITKLGLLLKKLPSKEIIINTLSEILSSAAMNYLKK